VPQQVKKATCNQPVLDGGDAPGGFRMIRSGVVFKAVTVADIGGFQWLLIFR
jgi:hypothetical protein